MWLAVGVDKYGITINSYTVYFLQKGNKKYFVSICGLKII
jgi:hypothetical protein